MRYSCCVFWTYPVPATITIINHIFNSILTLNWRPYFKFWELDWLDNWLWYFFGFASGLGYGFSLHAVSSVVSSQKLGLALGSVTASYAFGAVIFSIIYPLLFNQFTFKIGYIFGVAILSIVVVIALFLFRNSKINIIAKTNSSINDQRNNSKF